MGLTFTSLEFIFFLGVCLGLVHASGRLSVRTWLLIIFSYLFYLTFGVGGVLVVTFTAIADFIVGRRLGNTKSEVTRRRWLWVGLVANLSPLLFLKYSEFLVEIIAAFLHPLGVRVSLSDHPAFSIIGLSYFTFAGMSYVLDVYWERMEATRSLSEFVCYLTYFPKLTAGPIVRAADFLPQFNLSFKVTAQDFEIGCGYLVRDKLDREEDSADADDPPTAEDLKPGWKRYPVCMSKKSKGCDSGVEVEPCGEAGRNDQCSDVGRIKVHGSSSRHSFVAVCAGDHDIAVLR